MRQFIFRLFNLLFGVALYALGIFVTIKANIGYAPWDVLHAGLAAATGLSFGLISILVGTALVAAVTILGEKLGIGTLVNMVLIGIFIDIIALLDIIPTAGNFTAGVLMLFLGLFIISVGSYFYIRSAFGAGPRDNLMVILARKTGFPVGLCRFAVELLATLAGWVLGGMVGLGTVISAAAIGFCVQITFRLFKFDVTAVKHETVSDTCAALAGKKTARMDNP